MQSASDVRVKYSRGVHEEGREREESEVEMMEDGEQHPDLGLHTAEQNSQEKLPAVNRSCFRALKVTLGVFYLLILSAFLIRQLENINRTLSTEKKQLQEEVKQLNRSFCAYGWTRFGGSCYFKSTEEKRWSESRKDCQDRGADLVIITSPEEQNFLSELTQNRHHWIGLRTIKMETSGSEWQWVDGSQPKITSRGSENLDIMTR
ncbi:CD209 antigen-like protein A [Pholidichthys leucotaenia]